MLKGEKVLITGATGFLGGHLVTNLLQSEVQITAVDKNEPNLPLKALCGDRVKWVCADIITDDLSGYFPGVNIVYHLAGSAGQDFKELCKLNVDGTRNVAKAAVAAGVRRLIHISSAAVCKNPGRGVVREDDVRPSTAYGLSKLKSEEAVREICRAKTEYVILRPTAFFGEHHLGSLHEMVKAIKRGTYVMIGRGGNHMNFLYVKDLVGILIQAADELGMANQIYIVADTPITLRDFTNLTRKELGFGPVRFYIPKSIGLALGVAFDIFGRLWRRRMPLSLSRVLNMTSDAQYSAAKLLGQLPIQLEYGINQGWVNTIKWYKSQDLI